MVTALDAVPMRVPPFPINHTISVIAVYSYIVIIFTVSLCTGGVPCHGCDLLRGWEAFHRGTQKWIHTDLGRYIKFMTCVIVSRFVDGSGNNIISCYNGLPTRKWQLLVVIVSH